MHICELVHVYAVNMVREPILFSFLGIVLFLEVSKLCFVLVTTYEITTELQHIYITNDTKKNTD